MAMDTDGMHPKGSTTDAQAMDTSSDGTSVPDYRVTTPVEVDLSDDEDDDWDWDAKVSSITSSVFDYEYENGRRYHGYKAGTYPLPNDEKELDRLDLQHHVLTLALGGELYLAPLTKLKRVLDIGTGTGLWAIMMADKHPEANVLGVDLSPVQPDLVPSNAHFEIDDIESNWLYKKNYFDYIHDRVMIGSIGDWQKMIRQSFAHLKPGGWLELQELDPPVLSDDGTHLKSPYNVQFMAEMVKASIEYGKPVPKYTQWVEWLEEAGFENIEVHHYKIPINTWPKDARLKEIGKYQLFHYWEGYEGIGIGLLTRALGWTEKEFQVFLARARNELRDRSIHTYQNFFVVFGRKPLHSCGSGGADTRQTSPASGASSATGVTTSSGGTLTARPPLPLFPPMDRALGQAPPELAKVAAEAAKVQLPDSPKRPSGQSSGCGTMSFRINRNGELSRVRPEEDPNEAPKGTFYSFTVQAGQLSLNAEHKEKEQAQEKKQKNKQQYRTDQEQQQREAAKIRRPPPAGVSQLAGLSQAELLARLKKIEEEERSKIIFEPWKSAEHMKLSLRQPIS